MQIVHVEEGMPFEVAERYEQSLADLFLCATVSLRPAASGQGRAEVRKSPHPPCERCWRALAEVRAGGGLCARCKRAVSEAG